ncbi:hypothetical protein [Streptacidiphilus fuscans]|uniref:Uncharacterized protein n=1 Tax=Streptacidiphilus fuscans TaxID=2789292 RepID=A0A931F9F9_9ACTN|nr:hypothetical protein [Streptacidiphilus fuscans]MBF9066572.1 hypothetical protein [Streptacidiphilus fuscans]
MSGSIEFDPYWDVYRIRTEAGVLLGSEYGGNPCAFEDRGQALQTVQSRAQLAELCRLARRRRQVAAR